jgi:multidrug efflux pump subunit AcrB
LFFGSIALIPGGFIGGEFFASSDSGEFLVQIEMPKDASLEQTNFMTQKAEAFLKKEEYVFKVKLQQLVKPVKELVLLKQLLINLRLT